MSTGLTSLLLIWFLVFAVGDFATTFWLILHDPAGIGNEGNPFAASLYNGGGFTTLILAKVGVCVAIELVVIFLSNKYSVIPWFRGAVEALILVLIGYSLIIIYNNFLAILIIQALLVPDFLKGMRVVGIGMLILALILDNLFLYFTKTRETWMYLEANLATVLFLGPLIIWQPFFQKIIEPVFAVMYYGKIAA